VIRATAPGKVILLGEHAVVYGRPAIAAPVWETVATAELARGAPGSGLTIWARDLALQVSLRDAGAAEPLAVVARLALAELGIADEPDWRITLHSDIPIASGLGSGAALSTALVRALFAQAGRPPDPATVSRLVYESERFYHGTPSGIDNTVIAFGTPIWFVKGREAESFVPPRPFWLAIADSGVRSPTIDTVGDVRRAWQAEPGRYEHIFDAIAEIVVRARAAIEVADFVRLGGLMDENQAWLEELGVSAPTLETLIAGARRAGAWGAKLSGGGRGGNVIALVEPGATQAVADALVAAGARRVLVTRVG
jgi:mevalonate kinase